MKVGICAPSQWCAEATAADEHRLAEHPEAEPNHEGQGEIDDAHDDVGLEAAERVRLDRFATAVSSSAEICEVIEKASISMMYWPVGAG